MESIDISQSEEIFTVSRLNREVRFILEGSFPLLWVEGEISNFASPQSGHWYFSLKDAGSQVRCAMFRPHNRKLDFIPEDGMHVLLKARVSLYEGRGDFQLLAEYIEEVGEGQLRQAFEVLKKKLFAAGLFDSENKKSLPLIPQSIGVITSPTGAAIRDVLSVLNRRYPCVPVIIYPTLVQGEMAAAAIVKALQLAEQRNECDVIILTRGGGSLEDLWPFNEEIVAHAIFQHTIPIISGIGHEVDFTIADFVADVRAPTPSAAAELTTPDREELLAGLSLNQQRLTRYIEQHLQQSQQNIDWIKKHLQQQHPMHRLAERIQQLNLCEATLIRLQETVIYRLQTPLKTLNATLLSLTPTHRLRQLANQLHFSLHSLTNKTVAQLLQQQQSLGQAAAKLDALSPLATLQRGYAIATHKQQVVRNARLLKPRDKIHVRLLEGSVDCSVDAVID
jgi:exodeoxyribonuclease VII large subunit